MDNMVLIKSNGRLYRIPRMPHEPMAQVYERGWFIVEQTSHLAKDQITIEKQNQVQNDSFEWVHTKQGLKY